MTLFHGGGKPSTWTMAVALGSRSGAMALLIVSCAEGRPCDPLASTECSVCVMAEDRPRCAREPAPCGDAPCASGTACVASAPPVCLPLCQVGASDCVTGLCQAFAGQSMWGICRPPEPPAGCGSDSTPCGPGHVCVRWGSHTSCARTCESMADCPEPRRCILSAGGMRACTL